MADEETLLDLCESERYWWTVQNTGPMEQNKWMAFGVSEDGESYRCVVADDESKASAEAMAATLNRATWWPEAKA